MKKILLATSALAMTASFAAAEVSISGAAGAGVLVVQLVQKHDLKSHVWAGIDLNFGASVTTDSGITLCI